ncbi:hypothetical protein VNO80_23152 [Phaseolus coccineus]|uniref:Uncharacterized protein n=1 Tax=Phaseolus coccineus TaxID=3886 RepID=A0AAN9QVK8_PHACN
MSITQLITDALELVNLGIETCFAVVIFDKASFESFIGRFKEIGLLDSRGSSNNRHAVEENGITQNWSRRNSKRQPTFDESESSFWGKHRKDLIYRACIVSENGEFMWTWGYLKDEFGSASEPGLNLKLNTRAVTPPPQPPPLPGAHIKSIPPPHCSGFEDICSTRKSLLPGLTFQEFSPSFIGGNSSIVSWLLKFLFVLSASKAEVEEAIDEGEEEAKEDTEKLETAIVTVAAVERVCQRLPVTAVIAEETRCIQKLNPNSVN